MPYNVKPSLQAGFTQAGFTLVELIIGIVVMAISFAMITSFVMPTTVQSANQIHQIRAAELGQSMLNEILAKSFDENSDHAGGVIRCGQTTPVAGAPCSTATALGSDGETRELYNDVDDYICTDPSSTSACADVTNSLGDISLVNLYRNYRITVNVIYDGDYNGVADTGIANAKLITVTVYLPAGASTPVEDREQITFASYKVNF